MRYLHVRGIINHDLTGALPAIKGHRLSGIPESLESVQLNKLLRNPDRRTHLGCRNYAVLLLLARLGLRAAEVTSLQLEDIDWNQGEMEIRGKRQKQECLPLPADVGAALSSYLKHRGRSSHTRNIFIGIRTPFRPLGTGGFGRLFLRVRSAVCLFIHITCVNSSDQILRQVVVLTKLRRF